MQVRWKSWNQLDQGLIDLGERIVVPTGKQALLWWSQKELKQQTDTLSPGMNE